MNYAGGANGGGGGGPKRGEDSGGVGGGGGFNGESASGFVPGSGGFGGGGGGGSQSAGGGGFGGGGGGSYEGNGNPNGGFGGGGGGGAEISGSSGDGGFGGGGAGGANDTSADVGQGGFGGGGGSASNSGGFGAINPGEGGFGSGDGGLFAGSAGAGMGGSIFVVAGGTLTIAGDGSLDGTAKAGARDLTAGNDFYNPGPASAFGAGIFYQGKADGSSSTLNFGLGDQTITATVADYIGSGGTNPDPTETNYFHPAARAADEGGSVALVKSGGGVLALTTANTYSGGTFIKGGTVSDGAVGALGSGPVHFQADPGSAATLLLQKAVQPANGGTFATTLDGLGFGEALNLAGVAYTAGASAVVSGSVLTVTSGGVSQNFTLTNPEAPAYFVHKDAAGSGLLVNAVPVIVQASAGTTFASGDAREFDLTAVYIGKDAAYSAEIISDEGGTYLRLDNGSFSQTFGFGSTDRSFNFDFSSNTAAVTLTGGTFGDRLVGGLGDDTLAGGFGNDTYGVNTSEDLIFEGAGAGTDTVETSLASYTLGANLENLTYTGTGAFTGTGNELANLLTGGAGDDILDGRAGADTLVGGLGNDTYVVENAKDVVTEAAGAGIDTVETTLAKYTLGANVENLTYAGSGSLMGTGNALDNVTTGGAGNDTLRGGAGNDILIGNAGNDQLDGGTGDDLMSGGLGNDTYTVDSLGDRIDESENAGIDQVNSAVSFTLGTNLEKLALTGSAEISGIGNELDNRLVGNGAANLLEGRDGNDTLLGGAGDDTLYGDAGNDQLDGGTGADAMHGGAGNDTYLVDDVGDTVDETVAGGGDAGGADKVTLNADAYVLSGGTNYALSAYVETLSLTGTAALDATGNDLANRMTGNAGANSLVGGAGNDALSGLAGDDTLTGGAGNDTLTGGTGADTFVFGPSSAASADKVTDFSSAQGDRLQFQASDFGLSLDRGLTADKTLADGYFEVVSGKTTVGTENHGQFLFNTSTKVLSWDADGAGNGAAIAVATFAVPTGTAVADFLKASDFYIV